VVQTIRELGFESFLGNQLTERIDEIFTRHETLTPAVAADELERLANEIANFEASLDGLLAGLSAFSIGTEDLPPGHFEIGYLVPRGGVENELGQLAKDVLLFKQHILGGVQELVTGTRDPVEVRAISSSNFQFFVDVIPQVALVMQQIIEAIHVSYGALRQIRESIDGMRGNGVPEDNLQGLIDYASSKMASDITVVTRDLVEQFSNVTRPDGRPEEIEIIVQRAVTLTAERIDDGYSISVRSYALEPGEDDEDEDGDRALPEGVTQDTEEARRGIEERQPRVRRMNLTGQPILELDAGLPADDGADESGDGPGSDPDEAPA